MSPRRLAPLTVAVAVLGIAHLQHALHAASALAAGSPGTLLIARGWILLFWMVPAVAAVNMATEAFAPGLTALFSAVRAIWKDDPQPRAQAQ